MIFIENIGGINHTNNLLKNIPTELLAKLNISQTISESSEGNIEVAVLYGEPFEEVQKLAKNLGGNAEDLGYGYGLVTIPTSNIQSLAKSNAIQYIELPKNLILTDQSSNRAACVDKARNTYGLQGEGVVIGFIDSGIDYTHPAFLNPDGTTRIEYIYDLSEEKHSVYNKTQINEALKSQDPFSIVPVNDLTQHGTHVAGIACAGGNIDRRYYGVAPKSSIMMVKIGRGYFSLSTSMMRGLKFLVDKSKELNRPLVVNMSLSTNDGAHDGGSLLERYIDTIAIHERIVIVVAAGNEGDASHHVGGAINDVNNISFNVAEDEVAVFLNIYKSVLPQLSIELIAPTGVSTGEITIEEGYKEGVISQNRYRIYTTGPKPFDMAGEISVSLFTSGNYIVSGIWRVVLRKLNNYDGIYDIWLPVSEGLNVSTKFLEPTVENTLGIPATVQDVISVGSYDYKVNNISSFSGRGRTSMYFDEKPDLVAPGEGITAPIPNRSYDTKSGTSMATPHVSGICALIMEWGIVRGNDPYLFGDRMKYFLVNGAERERRDVTYPNISWGYGEVCAYKSIENLIDVLNVIGTNAPRGEYMHRQVGKFNGIQEYLDSFEQSTEMVGSIIEYKDREKVLALNDIPNVSAIIMNESYAIMYSEINQIRDILRSGDFKLFNDVNPPIFTLNDESPVEASNALNFHTNPYITLNGNGVLVGIIDTGIDYLNQEFMQENDTTRILRIWDQTEENDGTSIYGLKLGKEYTEDQINEAINLSKSGGDPYTIVPSKDEVGHGTMAAGLVAARGRNPDLVGVAPNCKLAVVKLIEASTALLATAGISSPGIGRYGVVTVLVAIRYLSLLASELRMPLVVLLSVGSNTGEHKGLGTLDGYIDGVSRQNGVVTVNGTGGEGDTDTHTEGIIRKTGDVDTIELRVGKNQSTLNFEIWVAAPNSVAISISSPSGEVTDIITPKSGGRQNIKFTYEGTIMSIDIYMPERTSGDERIVIRSIYLKEGIWRFNLHGEYILDGRYWAWIPRRSLLDPDTKFLRPSQYTTLCIPSGANSIVSVAYYNQNNNAVVGASGRGYTIDEKIKPIIAAGGVDAVVLRPGGRTGVASGSSVAASIVAGICALILQWAITDENSPEIYAEEIISYIIRGARMRSGDTYPNREWGYGMVDVTGIFNAIRGNYSDNAIRGNYLDNELSGYENINLDKIDKFRDLDNYEEFNIGELFIRKPILK